MKKIVELKIDQQKEQEERVKQLAWQKQVIREEYVLEKE